VSEYETLLYEERGPVAWVTMNRPEANNAFDRTMQDELQKVWRSLRVNDDIRVAILTGAGDRAFNAGIDRIAVQARVDGQRVTGTGHASSSPYMFDDVSTRILPKRNDLWKPVIAAVNGMACAGAFYLMSESDVIIASEHATFFDPHVSYGMVCAFEVVYMAQKMPFGEALRVALMGEHERMSARKALEIGLVSEVVPHEELHARAQWIADKIAASPPLSIQGTLRAAWATRELSRRQAIDNCYAYVGLGTTVEGLAEGHKHFLEGSGKREWTLRD
jgi:enoyl-CoA hydratase/carnithine racemase